MTNSREKWEYFSTVLAAYGEKDKAKKLGVKEFHPMFLNSILNEWGEKGWELIHIEPVELTGDHMIKLDHRGLGGSANEYYCVFKRRKLEQ